MSGGRIARWTGCDEARQRQQRTLEEADATGHAAVATGTHDLKRSTG